MRGESLIYENLVPSWNASQPKYMAFLRLLLGMPEQRRVLLEDIFDALSIEEATGKQLDTIGALVQADRVLPFAPVSAPRRLGDDDYRLLIRARIALNYWDGTNEGAAKIFSDVFPDFGIILEDGQDASINVVLRGTFSDLQIEMINAGLLIPHPAGILMTYEVPHTIVSTSIIVQAGVSLAGQIAIQQVAQNT